MIGVALSAAEAQQKYSVSTADIASLQSLPRRKAHQGKITDVEKKHLYTMQTHRSMFDT